MHIFIESYKIFQNFPKNVILVVISKQLYIVKLSSYILKEQLKFASFLGVEVGGGPKQPFEVSNIYL